MEVQRLPDPDELPPGWLPREEYFAVYRRVPRACVEVVISDTSRGVLLARRDMPPNEGLWHIPGGTVLFGETLHDAVRRVARAEVGCDVVPEELLGYIEYPSHYENGLDSPVGLAYRCHPVSTARLDDVMPGNCAWFPRLPQAIYAEQRAFLTLRLGLPADVR